MRAERPKTPVQSLWVQDHRGATPAKICRGFQKCAVCSTFICMPALLGWIIWTPQLTMQTDSLSTALDLSSDFWDMMTSGEPLLVQVDALPDAVGEEIGFEARGPHDHLYVGPSISGQWLESGLTPHHVLFHFRSLKRDVSEGTYLPGEVSSGPAHFELRRMGADGALHYMNTTLREHLPVEVFFAHPSTSGPNPWNSFMGHYSTALCCYCISMVGAGLAYTAQLRGRIESVMDRTVLTYFTIAMFCNGLACVGYVDLLCGNFGGLLYSCFCWVITFPAAVTTNWLIQYIMLLKVSHLEHVQRENTTAGRIRRLRLTLRIEKFAILFVGFLSVARILIPGSLKNHAVVHVSLGIGSVLSGCCILVFFSADLWFSVVCVQTYLGPLLTVRKSLRDIKLQQSHESEKDVARLLQKAYYVALLNLVATSVAVLTTTIYYMVLIFWTILGIFGDVLGISYHDLGPFVIHNNPWRVGHVDSVLNDLCTIVFADLLLLNFKESMSETRITWAIGHLGRHVAQLRQRDHEQQAQLSKGLCALASGPNPELRQGMVTLETALRHESVLVYETQDSSRVEHIFAEMKSLALEEMNRLCGLVETVMGLYSHASARYEYLLRCESFGDSLKQPIPQSLLAHRKLENGDVLSYLYEKADCVAPEFDRIVSEFLEKFNAIKHPSELGLDSEAFPFDLHTGHARKDEPLASKRWGPKKSVTRGWQKITSPDDYGDLPFPQAVYLLDVQRMQLQFTDPYALGVFLRYLQSSQDGFKVVRIKNRFLEPQPQFGYRDVLVNLEVLNHVVEIQLTLRYLAELKRSMHPFYKVVRSSSYRELVHQAIFCNFQEYKPSCIAGDGAISIFKDGEMFSPMPRSPSYAPSSDSSRMRRSKKSYVQAMEVHADAVLPNEANPDCQAIGSEQTGSNLETELQRREKE